MDIKKEREAFEEALAGNKIHNLRVCTIFDIEKNEYFASDVCDPSEDHIVESINLSWRMWQASALRAKAKLEGCGVVQPQGIILTCEEILEVLEFGAPDLKIERTEYSEEQMSTDITIVHRDTGHSGAGIYAYCTDCPEEGAIKLGNVEAARGGNHD